MTFPDFLRSQVDALGVGLRDGAGTALAAKACGVTDRTIRLWMSGEAKPNLCSEAGSRILLREAVRRRRKRLDPEPLEHLP